MHNIPSAASRTYTGNTKRTCDAVPMTIVTSVPAVKLTRVTSAISSKQAVMDVERNMHGVAPQTSKSTQRQIKLSPNAAEPQRQSEQQVICTSSALQCWHQHYLIVFWPWVQTPPGIIIQVQQQAKTGSKVQSLAHSGLLAMQTRPLAHNGSKPQGVYAWGTER